MATIITPNVWRAEDLNGISVPGALATFFNAGTTAERIVYADPECTIPHPSPLTANGAGVFPPVYDTGDGDVKVTVTTPDGSVLAGYPIDPAPIVATDETGAASVQFAPTVEIPATTVQAAIERVQANIVAPLAEFGLGVAGNAALLNDLNATGIASGFYRYDGTTSGTYPAGVTAANSGIVMVFRRTSATALMLLQGGAENRVHYRRLSSSIWQAWRRFIDDSDTVSNATWIAGTSTTPQVISPAALLAAMNADSRTWQNLTNSRNGGTTYRNTTGRTIAVAISGDALDTNRAFQVSANGSSGWITAGVFGEAGNLRSTVYADIPPGWYYQCSGNVNIDTWAELR